MIKEMQEHDPEKGDSWLTQDIIDVNGRQMPMRGFLVMELENNFHNFMERGETRFLKHIANYCAMIQLREMIEEEEAQAEQDILVAEGEAQLEAEERDRIEGEEHLKEEYERG